MQYPTVRRSNKDTTMKLKLVSRLICVNVLFIFASSQLATNDIPCEGVELNGFAGDPDDCTKFYQCNGDSFIHGTCPKGMYYHPIDVCSFDATYCEATPETTTLPPATVSTTTMETSTIPTTLETSTAVSTESNSEVEIICLEADPSKPRFVKSASNCSEFYICVNRKPMLHVCAPGMYWNDEQQYCDEPRNVRCEHDRIVNPTKFCKDSLATEASFTASPLSCEEYYI
ncbi:probable endochitinase, partial [Anopheles albimanus]|uniref:probable endochitinase n=1 Tax=Anopheles albimanus TaxID=7167 RepID=UPI00163F1709